ncbi:MAG: FkbM family methyltransferase [Leptolyngbyaceae cyanobacterium]
MSQINVIDIGAVGGFDLPWRNHVNKVGTTLAFEPNEVPILEGEKIQYNCAVWNFDGTEQFHVYGENGTGSSLLTQNFQWVKENFEDLKIQGNESLNSTWFDRSAEVKQFPCEVKKLDTILHELDKQRGRHTQFHFLKSDTQSGEFFVLDGARKYLENDCLGLELELFRYPLYKNMVLEDKVKAFLDSLGFEVAGWTGYKNSFLSQADYLFIRKAPRSSTEKEIIELICKVYAPKGSEKLIKSQTFVDRAMSKIKQTLTV